MNLHHHYIDLQIAQIFLYFLAGNFGGFIMSVSLSIEFFLLLFESE